MKKNIKLLVLCLPPLVGVMIFYAWQWILTPVVNDHPVDEIVYTGKFPFSDGYEIIFAENALTRRPWINWVCGHALSTLGRSLPCDSHYQRVLPERLGCCNYKMTFFRDRYHPGYADWVPGVYLYSAAQTGISLSGGMSGLPRSGGIYTCLGPSESNAIKMGRPLTCIFTKDNSVPIGDVKEIHLDFLMK